MAKTKVNGVQNVLNPMTEQMRTEVVERELRARFAKANYEIMYYSLESDKIQADYQEYVKRKQEEIDAAQAEIKKLTSELVEEVTNTGEQV